MTEVRVRIVSMGIFLLEAHVSHIPCAKSVLATVAKAGAVQLARYACITLCDYWQTCLHYWY